MPASPLNLGAKNAFSPAIPGFTNRISPRLSAPRGDTVRVIGSRNRVLGHALYSDRSEIALRIITRGQTAVDTDLWRCRMAQAIQFRETLNLDATAYRVVHGEADLLPSLIVDRYGDYLVVAGAVAGDGSADAAGDGAARRADAAHRAFSRETIRASGCSKDWSSGSKCCTGRFPIRSTVREGTVSLRRRSVARAEDRSVPRSAREPRGRRAVRARTAARRLQLQRRVRAGAGADSAMK